MNVTATATELRMYAIRLRTRASNTQQMAAYAPAYSTQRSQNRLRMYATVYAVPGPSRARPTLGRYGVSTPEIGKLSALASRLTAHDAACAQKLKRGCMETQARLDRRALNRANFAAWRASPGYQAQVAATKKAHKKARRAARREARKSAPVDRALVWQKTHATMLKKYPGCDLVYETAMQHPLPCDKCGEVARPFFHLPSYTLAGWRCYECRKTTPVR